MTPNAKRGFMPTDERDFSENMLPKLRKAAEEENQAARRIGGCHHSGRVQPVVQSCQICCGIADRGVSVY